MRMEFNSYVWKLYQASQAGAETIRRFSSLTPEYLPAEDRNFQFPFTTSNGEEKIQEADLVEMVRRHAVGREINTIDEAASFYQNTLLEDGVPIDFPDDAQFDEVLEEDGKPMVDWSWWYDNVALISLGLHLAHPEFYVPYMFRRRFDKFQEICLQFGIPLPPAPGKGSKEARTRYYGAINHALYEFRMSYRLSPPDLCAFLYDFAEGCCGADDMTDLPAPNRVWLVTGGTWDFDALDNATDTSVDTWGGNPAMRRGDIVMAYCVSPRSYIHSIWRACSDGFVDPFSHYHGNAAIGRPIKTVPVTYAEMAQDELLSKKPEIRAHLQGTGGKPFSVKEYEAILEIMRRKGQDNSQLPRIPLQEHSVEADLLEERDVEVHLIEPFLKRLGYGESDWIRQLPVKMGRGERIYPDYAIGAKAKRGEERAKMLVESKFQLSAHRDFEDAYYQAKSYALRLQSKVFVLAAIEGIWIFQYHRDDFEIKKFTARSWAQLDNADLFHHVLATIGKRTILGKPATKSP
jgi:hypothetical protein